MATQLGRAINNYWAGIDKNRSSGNHDRFVVNAVKMDLICKQNSEAYNRG